MATAEILNSVVSQVTFCGVTSSPQLLLPNQPGRLASVLTWLSRPPARKRTMHGGETGTRTLDRSTGYGLALRCITALPSLLVTAFVSPDHTRAADFEGCPGWLLLPNSESHPTEVPPPARQDLESSLCLACGI